MIYGKFVTEKEELETANGIIRCVFADELGLAEAEDEGDFILSALLFSETGTEPTGRQNGEESAAGEPAAAGRLLFDGSRFEIREVAVLPDDRGRGYGDLLVRLLADRAFTAGAREIRLDALSGTEGFFEAIGFEPAGALFDSGGGRWQPMILTAGQVCSCRTCQ